MLRKMQHISWNKNMEESVSSKQMYFFSIQIVLPFQMFYYFYLCCERWHILQHSLRIAQQLVMKQNKEYMIVYVEP